MKYTEDKATGDAGEYLFAYTVANILEWPCRLLDIDIGIDAQIEVLDDSRQSMGQFIAVQIKATRDINKKSISVEKKHIDYWSSLDTPVLLVLVNLGTNETFARPLEDFNGSQTLHFSTQHVVGVGMKDSLRLLAYSKTVKSIEENLTEVTDEIDVILNDLTDERVHEIEDSDHYLALMNSFKNLELVLHEIKVLLKPIHSIVGDCNYAYVLKYYIDARKDYTRFLHDWSFDIHDHDEVKAFENEYIEYWSYLDL
ncbi:DUF4365 domain-containing protein [Aliivibrio fischeri]|uniref:DUF4365 domain-containing protein n=1 Tax=Aliivibrio fischeri TaxID=668 RepID=UPI0007C5D74A|nr:DUF4365 domain-containing protein [Aliivibrio fischeri]